ncbi:MAG: hypothetical protein JWO82_978 [Akkermansiaceae bacterium]|nr:hypothetical protein [Akkermansiaceae bacterium]
MQSQSFKAILIIALSAFFAIYLGVSAATAQYEAIAWVAGFVGVAFILALGKNVWTLIPCGLVLIGTINALPGSPPAWLLGSVIVTVIYILRFAMRKLPLSFHFDFLDFAIFLQILAIGQAFARAPAGVMFFGGDSVGGKSYFIFAFAILAYFMLAFTVTNLKTVKVVMICMMVIAMLDGVVALVGDYSASLGMAILHIYSNSNIDVARAGDQVWDLSQSRGGQGFTLIGKALVFPCLALNRPLRTLNPLKPWLPAAMLVGVVLVALSGFRSNLTYLLVVFAISAIIRRHVVDIIAVGFIGVVGLGILLLSGQVKNMPFGVQRILSVLPIEVSSAARLDAENSTTWRVEMWQLALSTDRYIHNKMLGDGFGISGHEMAARLNAQLGLADFDGQEQMLATGTYHGFHVETIRFTGYFGLVCAIILMGVCGRRAWQLTKYYRGRAEFGYLAYLFIPFLIYPWWSLLIFGSYRAEFPQFIAMAGMLKLVDNLRRRELAEAVEEEELVPVVNNPRARFPSRPAFAAGRTMNQS